MARSRWGWDVLADEQEGKPCAAERSSNDPATLWGQNPILKSSCTSWHGGGLGDSAGSNETREKFYFPCNNHPL